MGVIQTGCRPTGEKAPKTNVARSSLEDTAERTEIIRKVYELYAAQLKEEGQRLVQEERYSLSWAMNQIPYLASIFLRESEVSREGLLTDAFAKIPMFIVEDGELRKAASYNDLAQAGDFWTISSPLTNSIEYLIREMPGDMTARALISSQTSRSPLPDGIVVCNLEETYFTRESMIASFEVKEMKGFEHDRRVDLRWGKKGAEPVWLSEESIFNKMNNLNARAAGEFRRYFLERRFRGRRRDNAILIPIASIRSLGLDDFTGIDAMGYTYLQPDTPIVNYLHPLLTARDFEKTMQSAIYVRMTHALLSPQPRDHAARKSDLERVMKSMAGGEVQEYLTDRGNFSDAVLSSNLRLFDPFAWSRRAADDEDNFFVAYN